MKRWIPAVVFLSACSSPSRAPEPVQKVDNTATRYVDSLRNDVERAKTAQEKANAAIAAAQNAAQQFKDQ